MSRKISRRIIIEGWLKCLAPLHVGGLESASRSDMTLSVNGAGQFYVPGTSLAGPLLAWCTEMWGEAAAKAVWGDQPPGETDKGWASFITVEDAVIPENAVAPEIRDGVGIDRYTGTAADGIKFDREILPAGTCMPLRLVCDEPLGETHCAQMLASLLLALQEGEVRFGAGKSRGLGKVELTGLKAGEHLLNSRKGILKAIAREPSRTGGLEVLCEDWAGQRRIRPLITIGIKWRPVGPLMVKAGVDGAVVDTLPLLSRQKGALRLVLPGSSSKGAIRSQAERIMATLFDGPLKKDLAFRDQVAVHPLVETLFGARNADEHDSDDDENGEALLGLSALSIDDCFSTTPFSEETWQHMLGKTSDQGEQQNQPAAAGEEEKDRLPKWTENLPDLKKNGERKPYLDPAVHVAIDRWTGGAAGEALFSVLEPWNFGWGSLCLTLDLNRLARHHKDVAKGQVREDVALAAVTLLLAVLDDFAKGEVPLGFATNRGCGAVKCESITVTLPEPESYYNDPVPGLAKKLAKLALRVENGKLQFSGTDELAKAWAVYLSKHGVRGMGVAA